MYQRFLDSLAYVCLAGIMVGQALCNVNVLAGQFVFLAANIIAVFRVMSLDRPKSDRIRDWALLALTIGLILLKVL